MSMPFGQPVPEAPALSEAPQPAAAMRPSRADPRAAERGMENDPPPTPGFRKKGGAGKVGAKGAVEARAEDTEEDMVEESAARAPLAGHSPESQPEVLARIMEEKSALDEMGDASVEEVLEAGAAPAGSPLPRAPADVSPGSATAGTQPDPVPSLSFSVLQALRNRLRANRRFRLP